ncbi:FecR family protein [Chitinophaga sp. YR573]|uniref:FecR family protein n=1 Tax=Chitinophaga sp. YR573 TaxID=1881040 RepID=UPI0008B18FE8|nr:FecR family protein [Chitinophaga sp. YR573]SEW40001.1 FecR family protein [Chitinophaga sp. YR573]
MQTSSDKAAILALLKKYRSGQCTPEEIARIHDWFYSFETEDDPEFTAAANEAAANVMATLFPRKRIRYMPLLRVAAILVVIITGLLFFFRPQKPVPVTYAHIDVDKGKRKKLTLPDGTIVTLNALSELAIPSNFGKTNRELFLKGEGIFDVKSDETKPFIVHTGELKTLVLGTSFDIKAYPGDEAIQVAVLTGKVRVEKEQEVVAAGIEHNQVLTYTTKEHHIKIANAAEIADWQANNYYFDQATIPEIADILERQYNINIKLIGSTKRTCRYTLQLKNESIEHAMSLLAQLSGITYHINNHEIKINTATCE